MATLKLPTSGTVTGLENNLDANAALAALATANQGTSAPTTSSTGLSTTAGLLWHDSANNALKLRNQADTAWITLLRINETAGIAPAFGTAATGTAWTHYSSNFTVTAAQDGQWFWSDVSGLTVTLPAASSLPLGSQFLFSGHGHTISAGSGTISINNAAPSSISLANGEFIGLQATESNWRVIVGSPRVLGAVMSVAGLTGDVTAAQIKTAIDLSTYALASALSAYAQFASPTFTGAPRAPTPTAGDNSTLLATTAFVQAALGGGIAGYAPLASPTLTGTPHAPTPATTDNSTAIATTAWVQAWYDAGHGAGGGGGGGDGGGV